MLQAKGTTARSALLGAGALLLTAGQVLAAPAIVETDSNFRSGPGTRYQSMGVLPAGTTVDVQNCTRGWCSVAAGPQQGYVARSLLSFGTAAIAPAPYAAAPAPYYGYGYGAGPYASFSYGFGGPFGWSDPWDYGYGYGYGPGLSVGFGVGF